MNVEVIQRVSQTATVLGKVTSPGVVPLDREMTVSTVLGRVGGALPTGAGYVVIQKENGTQKQVVISDLIKGGEFDPVVEGGDTLRSEEHTSAPVTNAHLVCRLLLEKKKNTKRI